MTCRDFLMIFFVTLYLVMIAQIIQELTILYNRIQQLHN